MSDRISKCCGWGVHLGGIPSANPAAQVTQFYACDQCMKACDVETIEQRDHRMRVQGATWAIERSLSWNPFVDGPIPTHDTAHAAAARIVAEHKEVEHGSA